LHFRWACGGKTQNWRLHVDSRCFSFKPFPSVSTCV
jgi:hypothetical protein